MICKLLIADDEPEIVSCLLEMIQGNSELELDLFKAYSANDALEIMETTRIDILLSDIKMPGLNGLQLLEKVKRKWPDCRVIFLTGYKEFSYAYAAIQSKGVRYLLKTEDDRIILGAVREAVEDIEMSLINMNILDMARQQLKNTAHLVQKEYLTGLINGSEGFATVEQELLDNLEVPLDAGSPVMMIVSGFHKSFAVLPARQRIEYLYSLKSLGEQYLPSKCRYIGFMASLTEWVWIIQYKCPAEANLCQPPDDVQLRSALELIQESCGKSLGLGVSIALSSKQIQFGTLAYEYHKLKQLLSSRYGTENNVILSDKSQCSEPKQSVRRYDAYNTISRLKEVETALESRDQESLLNTLTILFEGLTMRNMDDLSAIDVYLSVAMIFLKYINRWNIAVEIDTFADLGSLTRFDRHGNWLEASKYLSQLVLRILEARKDVEKRNDISIASRVRQYVITHLDDELSLTKLANIVFLNPSYLSYLFKECTGTNISDFISDMRLVKAKELLGGSMKRINEICMEIGYDSPHSFARFFRHCTGMSPLEYRESVKKT